MQKIQGKATIICSIFAVIFMMGCVSAQQTELTEEKSVGTTNEAKTAEKRTKVGAVKYFDRNYDSMLLYDKGYIYEYDGFILSRYQEDTMYRQVLYTTDKNVEAWVSEESFFLYQDYIYFMEKTAENGSAALLRASMDGKVVERIMESVPSSVLYIYEDILYMQHYFEEEWITDCYRLGNAKPEKIEQEETVYRYLKEGFREIDNMMLPYCMEHYGYFFLKDDEGNVVILNPETMKVTNTGVGSKERITCVTNRYIVSESTDLDSELKQYFLTSLDTLEKVKWYQSKQLLIVNGYDEQGLYYSQISNQENAYAPINYNRITWEGLQEGNLFTVNEHTGIEGNYHQLFFFEGNYYYHAIDEYNLYVAKRDGHDLKETLADKPFRDSRIAEFGHIEVFNKQTYCPHCGEVLVNSIYIEELVMDGNTAATVKINEVLKREVEDYKKLAQEDRGSELDIHDDTFIPDKFSSKVVITYLDKNYAAIGFQTYTFTGANYGMPDLICYVFDLNSGEVLELNDLIANSEESLKILITKAFQAEIEKEKINMPLERMSDLEDKAGYNTRWVLEPDGILFYFVPYEVAAFTAGIRGAKITFSKLNLKLQIGY